MLLALKSELWQAVVARPLVVSEPPTSKILPFSRLYFVAGIKMKFHSLYRQNYYLWIRSHRWQGSMSNSLFSYRIDKVVHWA